MTTATIEQVRSALMLAKEPLRNLFDVAALRQFVAQMDLPAGALPGEVPISEVNVGDVRCERFGLATDGPVLVYLHGGGFMLPPTNAYRLAIQKLARRLGVEALMPGYRLAPEHPFPAGLEDCLAVYSALMRRPSDVVLAGDSAGGGLAVSLVLAARSAGLPPPRSMYLMSPFTDLACSGASVFANAEVDPIVSPEALLHKAFHYLNGHSPTDPLASPFYGDLSGLPPTLIHVGSDEVMLDDSLRFAARARERGSDVGCIVHPGMPHIFPTIPFVPQCEDALMAGAEFLKHHLCGTR